MSKSYSSMFGNSANSDGPVSTAESLAAGWEHRSIQEALDELGREIGVRERVFPKWLREGKHTESDAMDRFQRIIKAASVLDAIAKDRGLLGAVEKFLQVTKTGDKP